ncbi:DUF3231 family protein [Bacillus sp. FJAT-45037]|uniref:DUF3231 family protein n=1 Tax=Bacillus sp. FJAT-45037 TaxID=2011007 RepID=UPI000C2345C3|nr:DUF3231 family protein [Bacillus sp. FJAT-45037]
MNQNKEIRLTSAEIATLWAQYQSDSASLCMLDYFFNKAEDKEIKGIIKEAISLGTQHLERIQSFFKQEKQVIPIAFNKKEHVNIEAPRLYSDSYVAVFLFQMSKIGMSTYSTSLGYAVRDDITTFYSSCLRETEKLFIMCKEVLIKKGLYSRSPYFPAQEQVEFINKQSFVLDLLGEKRPLTAIEVSHLYHNTLRNLLGIATLLGFCQSAKTKELTDYFQRGIKIAEKHIELCGKKMRNEHLPVAKSHSSDVTDSTEPVFSEKLMLFYVLSLNALGIEFYGTAIAQSPRLDLGAMYNKLMLDVQLYAEDGANLMIKNRWLEQPPSAFDRKDLANENKRS